MVQYYYSAPYETHSPNDSIIPRKAKDINALRKYLMEHYGVEGLIIRNKMHGVLVYSENSNVIGTIYYSTYNMGFCWYTRGKIAYLINKDGSLGTRCQH